MKKSTDIVCCWPKDVLYPYCQHTINKNRDLFNNVIVVMTQALTDRDYTKYLRKNLKRTSIIENYKDDGSDWRNAAIREALKHSSADRVLFLEQDFLVKEGFFEKLLAEDYNAIGFVDGNRFHPACLLAKRKAINQTKKNFSVHSGVGDHFVRFSKELKDIGGWTTLENLDLPDYCHLAGTTQNYRLIENFYHPRQFFTYLVMSGYIDQPEDWVRLSIKKINQVGEYPLDENIKSFFEEV